MMGSEIDNFLAQLDEISTDSASVDHFELKKQRSENKKLKGLLISTKDSTKEILGLYRSERQITINLQQKLDSALEEFNALQRQYDELERMDINKLYNQTQLYNELLEKKAQEHEDYIDLSKDYFNMLSDTTCFYNYVPKKSQNQIISRTERFLYSALDGKYKKPKIIRSKRPDDFDDEVKSIETRSSSRVSKREGNKVKDFAALKRRKTEIFDMKSISQASSPKNFEYDETFDLSSEICEAESSFSFNTFSIGNETSFSLLQSQKSSQTTEVPKCKCHLLFENETSLVSVGTNTDPPKESLPSLPMLLDEITSSDSFGSIENGEINNDCNRPGDSITLNSPSDEPDEIESTVDPILDPVACLTVDTANQLVEPALPTYSTAATNTETLTEPVVQHTSTTEQGTSPEPIVTSNKSTATVHSTTTRSTSTVSVTTKSCGVQFPDISMEKIFSETIFDLPDFLSPISDEELEPIANFEQEMVSTETMTELSNVNREIDYMTNSVVNFKSERSHVASVNAQRDAEEDSFIILGQTLFNVFLKRIRKSNESLSDEEIIRQKIWKHLKRQLFDRFSEIPIDDVLNGSVSDGELQDMISVDEDQNYNHKKGYEDLNMDIETFIEDFTENPNVHEETMPAIEPTQNVVTQELNIHENKVPAIEPTQSLVSPAAKDTELEVDTDLEDDTELESSHEDLLLGKHQDDVTSEENLAQKDVNSRPESILEQAVPGLMPLIPEIIISSPQIEPDALNHQSSEVSEEPTSEHQSQIAEIQSLNWDKFEEAIQSFKTICSSPPPFIDPIDDLSDVIWNSLFPKSNETEVNGCTTEATDVLEGYNIEHEPIEIPTELDDEVIEILQSKAEIFTEFETPKSPPPCLIALKRSKKIEVEIPTESTGKSLRNILSLQSLVKYDAGIRKDLVSWSNRHTLTSKPVDKQLCKARKAIKEYLDSEWTDENLEKCLQEFKSRNDILIVQAVHETVEDYKNHNEINTEFTPPAPPLPRYQQKLILLLQKLTENSSRLPHKLIENLEEKLFRLDNSTIGLDDLRNLSYYYSALVDLFFDGNTTMVFYFIVKSIYFFGYKSIPMAFVLLKAFPLSLPKKCMLLKKYSKDIDWDNMTGIEMSKVHLDLNWMDSLDLTVMHLLTCIQQYRKKNHESNVMQDHELFNFLPKFYGFPLSFMAAPKLLDILAQRFENGKLDNLSLSFILLAKRTNSEFTVKTMLKDKLLPLLNKCSANLMDCQDESSSLHVSQVCLLVETISTIMKALPENKDKVSKEIFPMFVSILGRAKSQKVQEDCIKAILRLQRLIDNHKEIYTIIQHHQENSSFVMSEGLQCAVQTFIHRKNENFFKNSN